MNQTSKLKTIDIKGKNYVLVNERIRAFRTLKQFVGYKMVTEIKKITELDVLMETKIYDDLGDLVANGHAQETKASSYINKTSYIENCETSAVGRALGMLGIGVTDSVGSAEEVAMAIDKQENDVDRMDARAPHQKDPTSPHYVFVNGKYRGICVSTVDEDELIAYYNKMLKGKTLKSDLWVETRDCIEHHLKDITSEREQYESDTEEDDVNN